MNQEPNSEAAETAQTTSDPAVDPSTSCSAWAVVKGTPDGLLYMAVTEGTPVRVCWSKNVKDAVEFRKERDAKLVSQVFWDAGSAVAHAPLPNVERTCADS